MYLPSSRVEPTALGPVAPADAISPSFNARPAVDAPAPGAVPVEPSAPVGPRGPEATAAPVGVEPAHVELAQKASYLDSLRSERTALGICAVLALAAMIWIMRPIGSGILIGTLMAFSLQSFYERLAKRTGRSSLTALGIVLASAIGLLGVIAGLSMLFVTRGVVIARSFIEALAPGGALRELAQKLSARLGPLQFQPDEMAAKLRDAAADLASRAATIATTVASLAFHLLLALFFAIMKM